MLIYHFETRDGLLREILGQARQRQLEAFTDLLRVRPEKPYPTTLSHAWSAMTGPHGRPYLRMVSRLHDTAGEPLRPGFRQTTTTDWLAPLEAGHAKPRPARAGHLRARRHPRPAHGPRRHRRCRTNRSRVPRLPDHHRERLTPWRSQRRRPGLRRSAVGQATLDGAPVLDPSAPEPSWQKLALSLRTSCGADVAYERRAELHQAFLDLGCAIIRQRFLRTF